MLRSKKGFTTIELVVVIAIAVVLAAGIVVSFVTINNKTAETADLKAQVAALEGKLNAAKDTDCVTEADVDAAIAAELAKLENVTTDEVSAAIKAAINSYKMRDLTSYNVQLMIDNAIAKIDLSKAGLTEAQVKKIVEDAFAAVEIPTTPAAGLTEAQVKAIVDTAVAGAKAELATKAQVTAAIQDALKAQTKGLTAAEVQVLINNALYGLDTGLSRAEVQAMIDAALNPTVPVQPAGSVETGLQSGGEVTLTNDYTMTETFSVVEDAVLDLGGNTLTLDDAFYGMDVFADVTIKNGYIETNRTAQLHTAPGGSLTLENVTVVSEIGVASPITNSGTLVINNCQLINKNPSNNWMISNGSIEHIEGGARYPGVMVISNTYIGGEYKTNEAVINNRCGTLTFGANVIINAMRPVEIEGGTPYYDIVEADPQFEVVPVTTGSVTINGVVVTF